MKNFLNIIKKKHVAILVTIGAMAILSYLLFTTDDLKKESKEIIKPLLGTFIGALLAFMSNQWFQRQKEYKENRATFFLTFYILRAQFDDFINYRDILHRTVVDQGISCGEAAEQVPVWAYAKPFRYTFNPSNCFDLKSLSFLLTVKTGQKAFVQLQFVERTYLELIGAYSDVHISAQEVQSELAKKLNPEEKFSWKVCEQCLGPALTSKTRDVLLSALLRTDRDESRFIEAADLLNEVGANIFGADFTKQIFEIKKELRKENLPPLPKILREKLDGMNNNGVPARAS